MSSRLLATVSASRGIARGGAVCLLLIAGLFAGAGGDSQETARDLLAKVEEAIDMPAQYLIVTDVDTRYETTAPFERRLMRNVSTVEEYHDDGRWHWLIETNRPEDSIDGENVDSFAPGTVVQSEAVLNKERFARFSSHGHPHIQLADGARQLSFWEQTARAMPGHGSFLAGWVMHPARGGLFLPQVMASGAIHPNVGREFEDGDDLLVISSTTDIGTVRMWISPSRDHNFVRFEIDGLGKDGARIGPEMSFRSTKFIDTEGRTLLKSGHFEIVTFSPRGEMDAKEEINAERSKIILSSVPHPAVTFGTTAVPDGAELMYDDGGSGLQYVWRDDRAVPLADPDVVSALRRDIEEHKLRRGGAAATVGGDRESPAVPDAADAGWYVSPVAVALGVGGVVALVVGILIVVRTSRGA